MIIPGLGMLMSTNDPQWGKGGGHNNGGGRRPDNQGPPDLDELWNDVKRRLEGLLGGGKGSGNRPVGKRNENGGNDGGSGGDGGESTSPNPGDGFARTLFIIIPLLVIVWLASGLYIVEASQRGLVLRFGKYVRKTDSGLQWRLPWPIESHEVVNLSGVRSQTIGYRGDEKSNNSKVLEESLMLTRDGNIIDIQFAVQFILKDPVAYLFQNRDPEAAVKQVAESAVREVVGKKKLDEVINTGRTEVTKEVRALMQKILDDYKTGIEISAVTMQNAQPPKEVQAAFADAVKAGQDKERAENEGEAYKKEVVEKVAGTVGRLEAEAETYKARIIAAAEGDADRFTKILTEYSKAPEVTRQRLYLETMQQVYANTSKVMVDAKGQGNLLYLPLD
jgi:membrane protease subunit HflK